jgi:hypothetical protein
MDSSIQHAKRMVTAYAILLDAFEHPELPNWDCFCFLIYSPVYSPQWWCWGISYGIVAITAAAYFCS